MTLLAPFADDPIDLAAHAPLRDEVRAFLEEEQARRGIDHWVGSWEGFDRPFSEALGARGWLGMAIPKAYGGHERGVLERYVVLEEVLAAGAPVACNWISDRQSAPLLLRFGTEDQKQMLLPGIASGKLCFAIGMSEPDSGSDLAALRTRATRVDGGWQINGTKVWTTHAHLADWMIALCRTTPVDEGDRHAGLTQFLIDLSAETVRISPIINMAGDHHFNEVVFDDHFVADDAVVGDVGGGWHQVISELAFERSGPDRFLSTFRLMVEMVRAAGPDPDRYAAEAIGKLTGRIWAIRRMSLQVAGLLERGEMPNVEAALVKDLGTTFEQSVPEVARRVAEGEGADLSVLFQALLDYDILHTPSFSLRGGTREVLRGIIARGLGLR
jgi:alkylation response protein AidB-like acyl-CoA dehydrogenase